jgi:glucosyl-3-phosphoglycerate synthase
VTTPAVEWLATNSHSHSDFPPQRLTRERSTTVSVCVPARDEEGTIKATVSQLIALRESGVVDEVLVVDGGSRDRTAALAAAAGADVCQEEELMPAFGPVLGKGDAMWRALSAMRGEIVCYVDADSLDFRAHFASGVLGPLLVDERIAFAKGAYRRPLSVGDVQTPTGGGRVTELTARPLLNLFYPELAGFHQPLAGEFAVRREVLERLPFATGYAVEIAMLIDAYRAVGIGAMAQVDLGTRQNRHQPLSDLSEMSYAVLRAVARRLAGEGDGATPLRIDLVERPPMASLAPAR